MLKADVFKLADLPEEAAASWRAMCLATPVFANPLLGLEFAQLVAEARDDARVSVFRNGDTITGILAHHRRPDGFARPIGAVFSDYHALLTLPGAHLDVSEALARAGISAWRFSGLIDPHSLFTQTTSPASPGYVLEMIPDIEGYRTALKAENPKRYKNWGRLRNKLEREGGEITLRPGDTDAQAFEILLDWKREHHRRTGTHDVFRPTWAAELLRRAFQLQNGPLRGVMSVLRAGDEIAAGHFGLATNNCWHGWISSINPRHASCGPGLVMMMHVPEIMAALDLKTYDMAPGHDHYKAPFATRAVNTDEGLALADSQAGRGMGAREQVWTAAGARRVPAIGRLQRRLDHIAAIELTVGGRMMGVVEALAGYGRRSASRPEGSGGNEA